MSLRLHTLCGGPPHNPIPVTCCKRLTPNLLLHMCACRLHVQGQRWVPITDCGIPYAPDDPAFTSGLAQGVFIKDATGQPYLGQVTRVSGWRLQTCVRRA